MPYDFLEGFGIKEQPHNIAVTKNLNFKFKLETKLKDKQQAKRPPHTGLLRFPAFY
jgi:hypothetical protein